MESNIDILTVVANEKFEKFVTSALQFQQFSHQKIFPILFGVGCLWNSLIIFYFVKINFRKGLKKMSTYHFLINILAMFDSTTLISVAIDYHFEPWELGEIGCVKPDLHTPTLSADF